MGHLGAGARRHQRGKTGVAEQVQHLDRATCTGNERRHMVPMRGLFGEDADMPKRGEAAEIVDAVMFHRPCFAERGFRKAPAAHPFLVGVAGKDRVGALPIALGQGRLPYGLPLGPDDPVGSILLQLASRAAVDQRIVGIGQDFENDRQALNRQGAGAARYNARLCGLGRGNRRRLCRVAGPALLTGRPAILPLVAQFRHRACSPIGRRAYWHDAVRRATNAGVTGSNSAPNWLFFNHVAICPAV